jgi:hypothetical protein
MCGMTREIQMLDMAIVMHGKWNQVQISKNKFDDAL